NGTCGAGNDPYTGYYVAYSVFSGFFLFGIIAFMWGYNSYISFNPQGSLLTRSVTICLRARRQRRKAKAGFFSKPQGSNHWLDWAKLDESINDDQMIEDLKKTMSTCLVFSVFPVYWV